MSDHEEVLKNIKSMSAEDAIRSLRSRYPSRSHADDVQAHALLDVIEVSIANREAVNEYGADATKAREFQLMAHPDPEIDEWIMQWSLLDGTVFTRTSIKISGEGLRHTIAALGNVARDALAAKGDR